jgi:ketosteroid isomerase-like protein
MSQENVDLVRQLLPLETDLVAVLASDDPIAALTGDSDFDLPDLEVEFAGTISGAPALEYRGLEGLVEGWRDWLIPYESYLIAAEEVIDAGDNVIMLVRVRARTSRDGVVIEHRPAAVWTVTGGKPVSARFFLERDQALKFVEER